MNAHRALHNLREVQHLLAGAVLALKAVAKFEDGAFAAAGLLAGFAALILIYFLLARFGRGTWARFAVLVHACEAAALCLLTYYYVEEGKTYLPYATFAAALGYFAAACTHLRVRG
jgi:hypothetical protein